MPAVSSFEQTHSRGPRNDARKSGATLLAMAVFAAATVALYQPIFASGVDRTIPSTGSYDAAELSTWRHLLEADLTYGTWLVSRNARALRDHPLEFFDSLHCAPVEKAVTLGIPAVAMGVVALPFSVLFDNPVVVYNAVLVCMTLLACWAMFLLVREWTGVTSAAIVAGLLFGFNPMRLGGITHPSQFDDTWTVFAIYFAYRLFVHARWRDAFGLALSFCLQATESFYPFLAAVVGVPPLVAWMLLSQRPYKIRLLQIAVIGAIAVGVLIWFYGPYLDTRALGLLSDRSGGQTFAPLVSYLPGQRHFPGIVVLLAALAAVLAGRRGLAPTLRGDPRRALFFSGLLVAWFAAGPLPAMRFGVPIPDLYGALGTLLPGLDSIRVVSRLAVGVQFALVVLAGIGTAALVRRAGAYGAVTGLLLVGLAGLDSLRPIAPELRPRIEWQAMPLAVAAETQAFYEELENLGNHGPLFELPFDYGNDSYRWAPTRILASHYHGRKTSACFGSFYPTRRKRLLSLAESLPNAQALEQLRTLGFTTIVAHHSNEVAALWRLRMSTPPAAETYRLRPVLETSRHSAWQIESPVGENGHSTEMPAARASGY